MKWVTVGHGAPWLFLAVLALVEWLRGPSAVLAAAAVGLTLIALRTGRERRASGLAALAVAGAAACAAFGSISIGTIESRWPDVQQRRLEAASEELRMELDRALERAGQLAQEGTETADLPRPAAFRRLERLVSAGKYESGIVVYDSAGAPWAWAGRLRSLPNRDGPAEASRIDPFYAALEARRQAGPLRSVASVLVDADELVGDPTGALAADFERRTGVGLRVAAGVASPDHPEPFAFEISDRPTGVVRDTLFMELSPPRQGEAKMVVVTRWSRWVVRLVLLGLVLVGIAGPSTWARLIAAAAVAWLAARAPLNDALFSPATFYRTLLGPFSASVGALGAIGGAACLGAIALWHRSPRVRWWSWPAAALLITGTPFALRELGRGISPPASGASLSLWLSWELALTLVTAALIVTALALLRGGESPDRTPLRVWTGVLWAAAAGAAGIWLWEPRGAWPDWYGYSWLPAVALITVPSPRYAAAWATAIVAGTAAAIITWGATIEGRIGLATRDVDRLGTASDPPAVVMLEELSDLAAVTEPPASAGGLYHLWARAVQRGESYPAWLGSWRGDSLVAQLPLAEMEEARQVARESLADSGALPRIETLQRIPGVHYLLVAPFAGSDVLTVFVGPRSRLVRGEPLVQFLRGDPRGPASYRVELGLPLEEAALTEGLAWNRDGWEVHGERVIELPGGRRPVHATVGLGTAGPILARGMLIVLLDGGVLAALWLAVAAARGEVRGRVRLRLAHGLGSYRLRLTVALATFVILPTLGFALWSAGRLNEEVRRSRDLVVRQTLRDVAGTTGDVRVWDEAALVDTLEGVARRLEAELLLYRGSRLVALSAPALAELGLVHPLLEREAFEALVLNSEVEATGDATIAGRLTRVGYRAVGGGSPEAPALLAAPQWVDDQSLREEQRDLAYLLALVTVLGLGASVWLAGLAARQLARPVAALREAAVAVGRGADAPPLPADPPDEFRDVMGAFGTMARDVRVSREQLDAARRRTARVLENVATGVVAVTRDLSVTLANPRAEALLGRSLEPGQPASAGDEEWRPVWDAVRRWLAEPSPEGRMPADEFDVAGRRIRVQVARLADGAVVALDDATELARAERVLAWGEMARQVAHEIKNPLTPLRLGLQHLERIYHEQPERFPETLTETSRRLLAEIARLDAIARAFSRFGVPPSAAGPLEDVPLDDVASEVVGLYRLADDGIAYDLRGTTGGLVQARRDEVQEVLINLVENARNAGATSVAIELAPHAISVVDDGRGIPHVLLDHIFEPRFSTTTSGSGLGLAIVRRMVESWGADVEAQSTPGEGTTVTVRWPS